MLSLLGRKNCFSAKNLSYKRIFMAQNYLLRDREETRRLRLSIAEARTLLDAAARRLHDVIQEEILIAETPMETQAAIQSADDAIAQAIRRLGRRSSEKPSSATSPERPTRRQGQFLAFIRE